MLFPLETLDRIKIDNFNELHQEPGDFRVLLFKTTDDNLFIIKCSDAKLLLAMFALRNDSWELISKFFKRIFLKNNA